MLIRSSSLCLRFGVTQRAQNGVAISFLSGTAGMVSTLHLPDHVFNASQLPPAKRVSVFVCTGCTVYHHFLTV